jgi:DNA-binding MarR family transcriptional regulator
MARYAEARIQPLGTGIAGYPVLNMLSAAGEMSQKQLTDRLGVEQSSMAQLLGRLERDGFIVRRKDPNDGRSSLVGLTSKAVETLPAINGIMNDGNDLVVAGMTNLEIDTAINLMKRMLANLENATR